MEIGKYKQYIYKVLKFDTKNQPKNQFNQGNFSRDRDCMKVRYDD